MTTYNTGNPIGSTAVKDLYDNAENLDEAVNTRQAESWDDRFGVARKTWWGMEQDFQQFLINSGYENIGDYAAGLEITARNQIFWHDGELYRAGAVLELPYTTTGDWGAEEGVFVAVGDQSLRQQLADPSDPGNGAAMVARGLIAVNSIADLLALPAMAVREGQGYLVKGYHAGSDVGGGLFFWNPLGDKINHNGGTIIDPSKEFPSDWDNQMGEDGPVFNWFFQKNTGLGCFVRINSNDRKVSEFGAKGNDSTDDTLAFNAATDGYIKYNDSNFSNISDRKFTVLVDGTTSAYRINGTVYVRKGQELRGMGLGPSRIFIPVVESLLPTFKLGVGVEENPYPSNPVLTTALSGSNTIVLSGNIQGGQQYLWLRKGLRIKFGSTWNTIDSINLGTNTTITLTEPLTADVPAGQTILKAEMVDSGGLPPSISNLATEGGHVTAPVIDGEFAAGMTINTLFITAAQLGINAPSGDVNIHTCTFDMGGIGISLRGSRNSIIGCHFFWNHYGIEVREEAYDWVISGCTFGFQRQPDVFFHHGSAEVRGITFDSCNFFTNEQYPTRTAAILFQSGAPRVRFSGCRFNNQPSWSIAQITSDHVEVDVDGCTFDGEKTHSAYNSSTASRGIRIGNGKWTITNNVFKGLHREILLLHTSTANSRPVIKGNTVFENSGSFPFLSITSTVSPVMLTDNIRTSGETPLITDTFPYTRDTPEINIEGNKGFLNQYTSGGRIYTRIPTINARSFLLRVSYNGSPEGSNLYRKGALLAIDKGCANIGGVVADYVTHEFLTPTPPGEVPGALDITVSLDSPTGASTGPYSANRYRNVVVSVPGTASNVVFEYQ